MPCAPCWPAGPSLCSSLLVLGRGYPRPDRAFAYINNAAIQPHKKLPLHRVLPLLPFLSFSPLSPHATNCLNFFCPSPLRSMWQRLSAASVAGSCGRLLWRARVKAKTAFRAKRNTGKRTHNTRCFWLPTAAFMLVPDLSTIFLLHWRHTLFTAGLHASCKFYGVRHVFGTTCRFLNMTAGSSPLSRLL